MLNLQNTITIFDRITEINSEKEYWFIRTDGNDYADFIEKGFIGIHWNFIAASDIREDQLADLRTAVILNYDKFRPVPFHELDPGEKSVVSKIIRKLFTFRDMKKGDIVLIQSENSDHFSIGEIDDEKIYHVTTEDLSSCKYIKRRKVNWLKKSIRHQSHDALFYSLKHVHQSIISVKKHADLIDSLTEELYLKNGDCFLSLKINKETEINLKDLRDLFDNYLELISRINTDFDFGEKIDATTVKLNLNSPGLISIKLPAGKSLIVTSVMLSMFLSGCSDEEISLKINRDSVPVEYITYMDSIQTIRKNLEVEKDTIFNRLMTEP